MNERLRTTLRAWPVITAATIGLCFLTQTGAKLLGIELPDQQNVEIAAFIYLVGVACGLLINAMGLVL